MIPVDIDDDVLNATIEQLSGSSIPPETYQQQLSKDSKFEPWSADPVQRLLSNPIGGLVSSRKTVLPMIVEGLTVNSRTDSGSEDNIMRKDLVVQQHLEMDSTLEHQNEFRIANGKFVEELGRIIIKCAFARDPSVELCCMFYIFKQLISSLIMGMSFFDETETLVRYMQRLQPRPVPLVAEPLQLCGLNNPRCRLFCVVDSQASIANTDTGSDIDLMSLAYVQRRGSS